jgi:hypothetical protein
MQKNNAIQSTRKKGVTFLFKLKIENQKTFFKFWNFKLTLKSWCIFSWKRNIQLGCASKPTDIEIKQRKKLSRFFLFIYWVGNIFRLILGYFLQLFRLLTFLGLKFFKFFKKNMREENYFYRFSLSYQN